MEEISRKKMKQEARGNLFKAVFCCSKDSCVQKGLKREFLDDGMMVIPLPDGQGTL
jgi:hypothetical protein